MRPWALLISAGAALSSGCWNECDFYARCEGNTLQECGGVDQVVNRRIKSTYCASPNPVCVEFDGSSARCVQAPPTECETDSSLQCHDQMLSRCEGASNGRKGYWVAVQDCSIDPTGGDCMTSPTSDGGTFSRCDYALDAGG